MCGNCRSHVVRRITHEFDRMRSGDVFHHNFQIRKTLDQRHQDTLDKYRFAVEHIDIAAGDFTMH